jgi:hypothetical protein
MYIYGLFAGHGQTRDMGLLRRGAIGDDVITRFHEFNCDMVNHTTNRYIN